MFILTSTKRPNGAYVLIPTPSQWGKGIEKGELNRAQLSGAAVLL